MKRGHGQHELMASPSQHADSDPYVSSEPLYLLTAEAAHLLRFTTPALFRKWAQRNRVPQLRRGRTLLYERRVLVAFLERRGWTKKHDPRTVTPDLALVKATAGASMRGGR